MSASPHDSSPGREQQSTFKVSRNKRPKAAPRSLDRPKNINSVEEAKTTPLRLKRSRSSNASNNAKRFSQEIVIEEIPFTHDFGYDADLDIQLPTEYDEAESDPDENSNNDESDSPAVDRDRLADRFGKLRVNVDRARKDSVLSTSDSYIFESPQSSQEARKRAHSDSLDIALDSMTHSDVSHGPKRIRRLRQNTTDSPQTLESSSQLRNVSGARPRSNCLVRPLDIDIQSLPSEDAMEVDSIDPS